MLLASHMLLAAQLLLLLGFSFFAFFNYLYGLASLWAKPLRRNGRHSARRIAVVIVSYNERHVLSETVRACERLSYANKLIVLADDSTDPQVVESLRSLAHERGCSEKLQHRYVQEMPSSCGTASMPATVAPIEILESPSFALFHRPKNVGYKAGSLAKVIPYLKERGVELLYLLDADWHPEPDALQKALELLESNAGAGFVQAKRLSHPARMNLFQRQISLVEEGCYYVDFAGRQALGHPVLFSGCCTLFEIAAIESVGGFTPGHLTEDLDLTNRFWLAGMKGLYASDILNYGEVPFTLEDYRRQQERWAAGSARTLRATVLPLLRSSKLSIFEKLSALRQNAFFTTAILTECATLLSIATVIWIILGWDSYAVEHYLYSLHSIRGLFLTLLYLCIFSNFIEPLVMILKKRRLQELCYLPMTVWYAWSVLHSCVLGNIKGFLGLPHDWLCTPKFRRDNVGTLSRTPTLVRALNLATCVALASCFFMQGWLFGSINEYALILLPAFLLACYK